jgi:iron-sulfur cluster assembly protein
MIEITEAATKKIGEVVSQQTEPVYGLRVSVVAGGCSGYQYAMSLAPSAEVGDWVGEYGGVRVLVDPESATFLEGARIDFVETLEASGFKITNPNAAKGCGCGKSFQTRESAGAGHEG